MNRSKARETAFKLLYQSEIQKQLTNEDIELFFENNEIEDEEAKEYVIDIVKGTNNNLENIIDTISKNLKKDWTISRVSKVNLALLKLAIYEIEYKQLPFKVVINEVVELAKKYCEEASPLFINGILASVVKEN